MMNYDYKMLAQGPEWNVQWKRIHGEESISLTVERGVRITECKADVLTALPDIAEIVSNEIVRHVTMMREKAAR